MEANDATWAVIYRHIKPKPVVEPYMLTLTHPVAQYLHKLRGPHFHLQKHIAVLTGQPPTCTLCDAGEVEDIVHFILHCPAYRARSTLKKQMDDVLQRYDTITRSAVMYYLQSPAEDTVQCSRILSRHLPPILTHCVKTAWQAAWHDIFNVLDEFLHTLITVRQQLLEHQNIITSALGQALSQQ